MLTSLANIKARLKLGDEDVVDDALLVSLADTVSGLFEAACNRRFGYAAAVGQEFPADSQEVIVERPPIAADGISKFELFANATDGWEEVTDVDFVIRRDCILSLTAALGTASQQARVIYTGGYVLPGDAAVAGVPALPAEIEGAVIEQIVFFYRHRDKFGLDSVSGGGASVSLTKEDWLPAARQVIARYEIWRL